MDEQNIKDAENQVGENFDTTGLLLDYLSHWKWFVVSVIACIICAYFYIASVIPTYQVSASIYLNDQSEQTKSAFGLLEKESLVPMKSLLDETEIEILKSRNNVIKIVDSLKMAYSYYQVGSLRDEPMYDNNPVAAELDAVSLRNLRSPITILVSNASDGKYDIDVKTKFEEIEEKKSLNDVSLPQQIELSHGTVTLSRVPTIDELSGTEKIVINNPRRTAGLLSKSLDIQFAEKSNTILRIDYSTTMKKQGIDVVNSLIDFYNRQIIEDKNKSAVQTEKFILDRLVKINDELRDVEQRLQTYRQENNITNIEAQAQLNLQQKSETEVELAKVDADMSIINSIAHVVSDAGTYDAIPTVSNDPVLSNIIETYNKKIAQLNRTLEGSTPDNPLVRSMQEDINRDKTRIMQNINSARESLQARRRSIIRIDNRSSGQLSSLPPIDKGLQEIFREQQVKVNIYTFLLEKREEIALQKTLATATARFIDDPDDPIGKGPISPKRLVIYFIAFVIGLLIPAGIIFVRRMIFPVFKDQEELQRMTNIPIIGEICRKEDVDGNEIVVGENVSSSIAELFRLLRNNISFTHNGSNHRVILLTSSISGEGKTFVATNLAMTYACTGKKVAVLGLDIRRPVLARRFGLSNQQGISTFLSGQCNDIREVIHQSTQNPNLYILPAGPVPPNPNELLLSDNMSRMIEQLRHDFDYVIIDSAPIGVVSDTYLIVRHSDIQLYVARAGYTTKSSLKVLHQAVAANKLPHAYLVLNGVNMRSGAYLYRRYGHYGHYGSTNGSYGYGYGYGDDKGKGKGKKHRSHKK